MRDRPIRPLLFQPIVWRGVHDRDWKWVALATFGGFLIPARFGLVWLGMPVAVWSWFAALAGSIGFFSLVRLRRRPEWLALTVAAWFIPAVWRGWRPRDRQHRWLV